MFGDFFNNFGVTGLWQQFQQAMQQQQQAQSFPVDAHGGMFAPIGGPTGHEPGLGTPSASPAGAPGGAPPPSGPGMAAPAPTGSAVAPGLSLAADRGSPLGTGATAPFGRLGEKTIGGLEQGADDAFQRAGGDMAGLQKDILKAFGMEGGRA